jgi:glucose/arabinose dehydrogenase
VALTQVVAGLEKPIGMETPDDGSGRSFIVEQVGRLRIFQGGVLTGTFLDISGRVSQSGGDELGLLGVTFHPNFASDGRFYVNYTRTFNGQLQSVIAEYKVSSNPNQADPASERILLTQDQPFPNHKAGQLAFGPDGFLYFTLGDGGGEGDPHGNGQNTNVLLGKMMRIDVNSSSSGLAYGIPPDNPFVAGGGRPEIYAFGFRNPWRFSFDGTRLFVADVGQNNFEEIDLVTKGGNFGWSVMEGAHCFNPATGCDTSGKVFPIAEYDHTLGICIIGGYVYHGNAIPNLANDYVFADLNGKLFRIRQDSNGAWNRSQMLDTGKQITSFGKDANGELYILDLGGKVSKLVAQ